MQEHNHILKIIEETLNQLLEKSHPDKDAAYKSSLRDYIFTLLSEKYSNDTTYARTQTIDLQLKADIVRELGAAIAHIDKHPPESI